MSIIFSKKTGKKLLKDFDKLFDLIKLDSYINKGEKILIKPNICSGFLPLTTMEKAGTPSRLAFAATKIWLRISSMI